MLHRPVEQPLRDWKAFGTQVAQLSERDQALGSAMHIKWQGAIMKIFRTAFRREEVAAIEIVSFAQSLLKLIRLQERSHAPQRTKIEASMEIVDVAPVCAFAVHPRAIGLLPGSRIASGFQG